ncbi:hypothetical protein HJFPF1_01103 [Paramyrothecium foliicola]|nr:hypothetical protein HJFPF1_01103 [Paramyrothecium foliicola]
MRKLSREAAPSKACGWTRGPIIFLITPGEGVVRLKLLHAHGWVADHYLGKPARRGPVHRSIVLGFASDSPPTRTWLVLPRG